MRGWIWGCGALLVAILHGGTGAWAQEGEELNWLGNSTSLSGLTGLVTTASAHTLPPWKVAVSGALLFTQQSTPDVTALEGRAIVALGLPGQLEAALMAPGVRLDTAGATATGLRDVQLAGKWRFLDQREDLWPSLALATIVTLPTGQESKGLRTVQDYGVEIKLLASAEVDFSPDLYAIGLYVNGGFFLQDSGQATQEKFGTFAFGAAFPLVMLEESPMASPLQLLLETTGTYKRGDDQDIYTVTPSLRYIGPVTATIGFQYTTFQETGMDNAIGGVAQVSFVFP